MQVVLIGVDNNFPTLFGCHATSLDKLKNKVQIHHLHVKCFHMVKKIPKIGPVYLEIFD